MYVICVHKVVLVIQAASIPEQSDNFHRSTQETIYNCRSSQYTLDIIVIQEEQVAKWKKKTEI